MNRQEFEIKAVGAVIIMMMLVAVYFSTEEGKNSLLVRSLFQRESQQTQGALQKNPSQPLPPSTQSGRSVGELKIKREVKKAERVRRSYDNVRQEIDSILDRINEVGYENLTDDEKQKLEEASRVISKDKNSSN